MIEQVFHVATEFRFDIGQALLSTQQLQDGVNRVSDAADNALMSFQHLGAGLVANLGLGSGGLLTVLGKALQISDKFNNSALSFSNIISSNMKVFAGTIDSFNDRLDTSKMIMMDINKVANQFALPSTELLAMTKLVTPLMAQHGMAGTNFSNAIDLSKNVLKSAPNLGIMNPAEVQGQLLNAINGQAHMQGQLFPRLMRETTTFRDAHINSSQQFNALAPEKRIDLLRKALAVFASDTDVLKNRVASLTGQMTLLENNLTNFGSILRPIGDALTKPVVMILQGVNKFLDTDGRKITTSFGKLISNIFEDPKNLLTNILQLRQLGADTKKGANLMGMVELVLLLRALKNFGPMAGVGMFVQKGLFMVFDGLKMLAGMIPFLTVFRFVLQAVGFVITRLLPNMLAAVGIFQVLSRARAIAKINDAENLITLSPKLMDLVTRFKVAIENILMPLSDAIEGWSKLLAPLFQVTTWVNLAMPLFEGLVSIFEKLGEYVIKAYASLEGLFFAFFKFGENLNSFGSKGIFSGVGAAFSAGIDTILEKYGARLLNPSGAVVNQVTNIGKVEIRNDFKENQEPDRIAFTLKEQLMKAAKNPTQGRGTALQGAFAR